MTTTLIGKWFSCKKKKESSFIELNIQYSLELIVSDCFNSSQKWKKRYGVLMWCTDYIRSSLRNSLGEQSRLRLSSSFFCP